jgi:hypothetical protein
MNTVIDNDICGIGSFWAILNETMIVSKEMWIK